MGIVKSLFGGSPPPLQPKGPAPFAQPAERDRQALFWWLKRNTSYTAIEHNAGLWAAFAREWETWLRSQDAPHEHLIETLKYILDDQLRYERGLKRLKRGDRSVFDRSSSEGWLGKINTWLVQRRMEWDDRVELIAEQDGVPLSLLRSYYSAHDAAMAMRHSSWYRGPGEPEGDDHAVLDAMPGNAGLPEPRWDVSFQPGGRSPKDGIYEQVNADGHIVGGMAFFIKGQTSKPDSGLQFGPNAWVLSEQPSNAFFWRLLWEDTRYKDGAIPDEERHYPTPTDSVAIAKAAQQAQAYSQSLRCESTHPCPQTGYWHTPAQAGSRRRFEAGELMPELGSGWGTTIWQWDESQQA